MKIGSREGEREGEEDRHRKRDEDFVCFGFFPNQSKKGYT